MTLELAALQGLLLQVKRGRGDASGAGTHSAVVDAEMVIARGTGEDLSWLEDPRLPLMRHVSLAEGSLC